MAAAFSDLRASEVHRKRALEVRLPVGVSGLPVPVPGPSSLPPLRLAAPRALAGHARTRTGFGSSQISVPSIISEQQANQCRVEQHRIEAEEAVKDERMRRETRARQTVTVHGSESWSSPLARAPSPMQSSLAPALATAPDLPSTPTAVELADVASLSTLPASASVAAISSPLSSLPSHVSESTDLLRPVSLLSLTLPSVDHPPRHGSCAMIAETSEHPAPTQIDAQLEAPARRCESAALAADASSGAVGNLDPFLSVSSPPLVSSQMPLES